MFVKTQEPQVIKSITPSPIVPSKHVPTCAHCGLKGQIKSRCHVLRNNQELPRKNLSRRVDSDFYRQVKRSNG